MPTSSTHQPRVEKGIHPSRFGCCSSFGGHLAKVRSFLFWGVPIPMFYDTPIGSRVEYPWVLTGNPLPRGPQLSFGPDDLPCHGLEPSNSITSGGKLALNFGAHKVMLNICPQLDFFWDSVSLKRGKEVGCQDLSAQTVRRAAMPFAVGVHAIIGLAYFWHPTKNMTLFNIIFGIPHRSFGPPPETVRRRETEMLGNPEKSTWARPQAELLGPLILKNQGFKSKSKPIQTSKGLYFILEF